ncbi:MAG: hypothetical protein AAFR04_03670 [Pseudomonadota bacterium]
MNSLKSPNDPLRHLTGFNIALIIALAFISASTMHAHASNGQSSTYGFRNATDSTIVLHFYTSNSRRFQPKLGSLQTIGPGRGYSFKPRCKRGEKICYGAASRKNSRKYWGCGLYNFGSGKCCHTCGRHDYKTTVFSSDNVKRIPSDRAAVTFINETNRSVNISLFSKRASWPSPTTSWRVRPGRVFSVFIRCTAPGSRVCYGGAVRGNSNRYYGKGLFGKESCRDCCFRCGNQFVRRLE